MAYVLIVVQLSVSMAGGTKAARQLHEDAVTAVFRDQLGLDPADNTGAYLQARSSTVQLLSMLMLYCPTYTS